MTASFRLLAIVLLLAATLAAQTGSGVVSGTWGVPSATGGSGGTSNIAQLAALPLCTGSAFDQSFCDARNPSPYPDTTGYAGINPKITVCASGCTYATVQAALNAVSCGTIISVKANQPAINQAVNYSQSCDVAHWIIIRSDASDASLPAITQRLQPAGAHAALMGNLTSTSSGAQSVVYIKNGAKYLWIGPGMNLDLEDTSGNWQAGGGVILSGDYPTSVAQVPHHIVVDRSWLHGKIDNTTYSNGAIFHWGDFLLVQNSVLDHIQSGPHTGLGGSCTSAGGCAEGVELSYGGPHKIYNNTIDADGINIFHEPELQIGSQRPPDVTVAVVHDETIARNYLTKAPLRNGQDQVANVLEWKEGNRVLVEANVLEDAWMPFQVGHLISINPDCGFYSSPNFTVGANMTFRYNIMRTARVAIDISAGDYGFDAPTSNCGNAWAKTLTSDYTIAHNLIYDIGQNGQSLTWFLRVDIDERNSNWQLYLPTVNDLNIEHNTFIPSYTQTSTSSFFWQAVDGSTGMVFKNNILPGYSSSSTILCADIPNDTRPACLTTTFPSATVANNAWVNASSSHTWWPAGWGTTYWFNSPADYSSIGFADANNCGKGTFSTSACAITSGSLENGASDGTDVGADINGLVSSTAHSTDGQW